MKKLIEWVEQEPTRARRVVLFSTIFAYLLVTGLVLLVVALGKDMTNFSNYYFSFSTVAAICIGFYTGIKPKIPGFPKAQESPKVLNSLKTTELLKKKEELSNLFMDKRFKELFLFKGVINGRTILKV